MKNAKELLSIDFSKYETLMLDKVFIKIKDKKVVVRKGSFDDVVIDVINNDECLVSAYYDKCTQIEVRELEYGCFAISRSEE